MLAFGKSRTDLGEYLRRFHRIFQFGRHFLAQQAARLGYGDIFFRGRASGGSFRVFNEGLQGVLIRLLASREGAGKLLQKPLFWLVEHPVVIQVQVECRS